MVKGVPVLWAEAFRYYAFVTRRSYAQLLVWLLRSNPHVRAKERPRSRRIDILSLKGRTHIKRR